MSYGAAQQLLLAGLSDPQRLIDALQGWSDETKRCHALIAVHAYKFITANAAYMEAQKRAMDLLVETSQARIYLHNAIVDWQRAVEAQPGDEAQGASK
jgi:hypothetical protein